MRAIGVIPARWGSTRFEGKVLADIAGKPMIQHVWERVRESALLDDLIIACDQDNVYQAVLGFGAKAVMTRADHLSGTDRVCEVVKDLNVDFVVNIQGDEPMIHHSVIDDLVSVLKENLTVPMATAIKLLEDAQEINDPNVVKVVIDHDKNALYFSRAPIPFNRDDQDTFYYKHLGIYAYKKEFLLSYADLPTSALEEIESLEQLRALEAGHKIKTILTDIKTIGIDTPEDLLRVKTWIQ